MPLLASARPALRALRLPRDFYSLLLIAIAALVALRSFWRVGVASDGDMLEGIYRVVELDRSWHMRALFPRLGMGLDFGYGAPLFQYYPPLASYLALPAHWAGMGWIEGTKLVFALALLLAGFGAYYYARWLFANARPALVAALAYVLAPYLLLDIYERGALAELLALALLPWLVWAGHRLLQSGAHVWFWSLAILTALTVLAHNSTALFVLPLLVLYLALLAWHEHLMTRLALVGGALAIGLGLSAFYWVPALAEQQYSQLGVRMFGAGQQVTENLVSLRSLVQPTLAFDYWGPLRFRLAHWQAVLTALALIGMIWQPARLRFRLWLLAGGLAVTLILQLDFGLVFWRNMPLVSFIQFPWRLLGPAAFCSAILIGSLFGAPLDLAIGAAAGRAGLSPGHARAPQFAGWAAVGLLVALIAYGSLRNLDPGRSSIWLPLESAAIGQADLYARGAQGYPLYDDYAPVTMRAYAAELADPRRPGAPVLLPLAETPTVQVVSEGPQEIRLQVNTASPFTLRLPRIYYPGWQIYVNGRPIAPMPQGRVGLLGAELPAGNHDVVARFGETSLRGAVDVISIACFLVVAAGLLLATTSRQRLLAGVAGLALAVLALGHGGFGQPVRHPVAHVATYGDEIQLLGYALDGTAWRPGDTVTMRLYWLALRQPGVDYAVVGRVVGSPDGPVAAATEQMPVLGTSHTTRWDPGEVVVDEQQILLDKALPAGDYTLTIGLRDAHTGVDLPVVGAGGNPGGSFRVLTPIIVQDAQ